MALRCIGAVTVRAAPYRTRLLPAQSTSRAMHSSSPAQAEVRSTTASGSTVYESARATDEYLQFHFGAPHEVLPYEDAPHSAPPPPYLTLTRDAIVSCVQVVRSARM